jgi:hypothetical protein
MHKMSFGCFASSKSSASKALLLAESIRTFAEEFSGLPFLLVLSLGDEQLTTKQQAKMEQLDVNLLMLDLDPEVASFPFAGKVVASAAAESFYAGVSSQLVWMDAGALVINPLDQLLLTKGIQLGYRPVDHLLIGSPYDQPVDPFWEYIYSACGVRDEDIYPMVTSTDQVQMRPYINAGMLVVRPENKLLQGWRDTFLGIYQDDDLIKRYEKQNLYRIFIHQAVLAGCVISGIQQKETTELPHFVNYPLHMHSEYPKQMQPANMNQLISFRYEQYFTKPNWKKILPAEPPLGEWLLEREKILTQG